MTKFKPDYLCGHKECQESTRNLVAEYNKEYEKLQAENEKLKELLKQAEKELGESINGKLAKSNSQYVVINEKLRKGMQFRCGGNYNFAKWCVECEFKDICKPNKEK